MNKLQQLTQIICLWRRMSSNLRSLELDFEFSCDLFFVCLFILEQSCGLIFGSVSMCKSIYMDVVGYDSNKKKAHI